MVEIPKYVHVVLIGSLVFAACVLPRLQCRPRVSFRSIWLILVPIGYYVGYYVLAPPPFRAPRESIFILTRSLIGAIPWMVTLELFMRRVPRRRSWVVAGVFAAFFLSVLVVKQTFSTYNCLQYCLPIFFISYLVFANTENWEPFFDYLVLGMTCTAAAGVWHLAASYTAGSLTAAIWLPLKAFQAGTSYGNVPNPLMDHVTYANFLLPGIAITWAMVLAAQSRQRRRLLSAALTLQMVAVLLSQCRACMFGLLVIALACSLMLSSALRNRKTVGILVTAVVLLLTVGTLCLRGSYGDPLREQLWKYGWTMFSRHPVFGVGLGQEKVVRADFYKDTPSMGEIARYNHLHSQYLQILVVGGVIGGLAAALALTGILLRLREASKYLPPGAKSLLNAFVVGVLGSATVACVDVPWIIWKQPFSFAVLLGLFLGIASRQRMLAEQKLMPGYDGINTDLPEPAERRS